MSRTVLWRCIQLCARAPSRAWRRTAPSIVPPSTQLGNFGVCSSFINAKPFSSESNSSAQSTVLRESNSTVLPNQDSSEDVDDISTEELKKRMDKYFEGDDEAIPEIFEAILARKLSGKHENSDDELMNEIRAKMPHNSQEDDFELDDSDKEEETDEELELNGFDEDLDLGDSDDNEEN